MQYWKSYLTGITAFILVSVAFALATTGLDLTYPGDIWYGVLPLTFKVGGGAPLIVKAFASGFVITVFVIARLAIAAAIGAIIGIAIYGAGRIIGDFFGGSPKIESATASPVATSVLPPGSRS